MVCVFRVVRVCVCVGVVGCVYGDSGGGVRVLGRPCGCVVWVCVCVKV